jgi:DNA-binding NarL/FixJ family response regulator
MGRVGGTPDAGAGDKPPAVARKLGSGDGRGAIECLSVRERAVVKKVTEGLALKVIAHELNISPYTAATYLARARRKLQQSSRWKLAVAVSGPLPPFRDLARRGGSHKLAASELVLGEHILSGLSNAEIAKTMKMTERAAARHVERLLRKVGLRTRGDLIALGCVPAKRRGRHEAPVAKILSAVLGALRYKRRTVTRPAERPNTAGTGTESSASKRRKEER